MKKITSFVLAVVMVALCAFTFSACSNESVNKVGVQAGTTGFSFMSGDEDWGFTGFSNLDVKSYENAGQAIADMKNGNISYVVIDADVAKSLVAANDGVKMIDIALTTEAYGIAVDKNQSELLASVNKVLSDKKSDIDAIFKKYENVDDNNSADWKGTTIEAGKYDESKNQLVVATNAAFEPFEYMEGTNYYGIDMEIAAALAEELGLELVIQNMDFEAVCLSVGQHNCDIAMAGLTVKPEREEYVTFSTTYYNASQKLITKIDDTTFDACTDAASVEAILSTFDETTKIGTQNGTTGSFYVTGDEEWGFDGFGVTSVGYANGSLAVQDLINGNIQYVIIDSAPAKCITDAFNN